MGAQKNSERDGGPASARRRNCLSEYGVKSLFKRTQTPQPFLAPLAAAGRFSRMTRQTMESLPPAAAPIAVTIVGGVLLLVVLGMLLSRTPPAMEPVNVPAVSQEQAAPAVAVEVAEQPSAPAPADETPALVASDLKAAELLATPPDPSQTSSILQAVPGGATFQPIVPIAESEEEIAALEEAQRSALIAQLPQSTPGEDVPAQDETTASLQPQSTPKRPAIAKKYVNLRAAPNDDADVLLVVPALADIEAQDDCRWCEVTYDGRIGYIFTNFIEYKD